MPRYNYTDRSRIYRKHVNAELKVNRKVVTPSVDLDLGDYEFPANAPIWVELYTASFLKRLSFGTVENQGFKGPRAIQGGPDASELKIRVKVLHPDKDSSKILGVMKGCKPGYKEEKGELRDESLLELRSSPLDGEIWKVEVPQERDWHPILHIDKRVPDYRGLAGSSWFKALILPKVFQEVLVNIIVLNGFSEAEDNSVWGQWLQFARQFAVESKVIPVVDPEEGEWSQNVENAIVWIDAAVGNWARSKNYREDFCKYLKEGNK
jgi:hypothetical protein